MARRTPKIGAGKSEHATHVFRQFAWNLAGTLASGRTRPQRSALNPRPATQAEKR